MKQVININFQGRVIPIEVSAFELLKSYTDSLAKYFSNEDGKEEIINDIENRIGELFQERLKAGVTCITDDDVNAIIRSMGRPEDLEAVEETTSQQSNNTQQQRTEQQSQSTSTSQTTETHRRLFRDENHKVLGGVCSGFANYFGTDIIIIRIIAVLLAGVLIVPYLILWVAVPSSASVEIGGARKKLYRDSDDKIIAGVGSGLGNYFGVNPWIPRVLFLLPFLSFIFHWSHMAFLDFPNFIRFSFSPGSLMVYIILWLVIPEAVTTAEKLEMKGEKVDLNSIKNSVMEEMKGVKQRAEKFGQEAKTFAEEKGKTVGAEMSNVARRSSRSFGDIILLLLKIFGYFIIGVVCFVLVVVLFAIAIGAIGVFPLKDFIINDGWQNILAWGTLIFFIAVPVIGVITWIIRRLTKAKKSGRLLRFSFISLWIIGWASVVMLVASIAKNFKNENNRYAQPVALINPTVDKLEITGPDDITWYNARNNFFRFAPFTNINDEDTLYLSNVHFRIVKSNNDSFQVSIMKLANGESRKDAEQIAAKYDYTLTQYDTLLRTPVGIAITRNNKFRNQHAIVTVAVPVGKRIKIDQKIWKTPSGRVNIEFDNSDWDDSWGNEERGWTTNVEYIMKADGLYTMDGIPAYKEHHDGDDDSDEPVPGNIKKEIQKAISDSIKAQELKDSIQKNLQQPKQKAFNENKTNAIMIPTGLPIINSMMQ